MLPRADIGLAPVARVEGLARLEGVADARQEGLARALAGSLGKQIKGEVLARLADGSFLVKVADTPARMLLPPGTEVGHQIPLTLVALTPRPTFQIATQGGPAPALAYAEAGAPPADGSPAPGARAEPLVYLDAGRPTGAGAPAPGAAQSPEAAQQAVPHAMAQGASAQAAQATPSALPGATRALSHGAALLAQAPLVPAEQLPPFDPKSTPATLSDTARALASVLTAAGAKTPSALVAPAPLVASPAAAPHEMAAALRQSLAESGLFYESHVAEWSAGNRPLAALAREPQMQMQKLADGAAPSQPSQAAGAGQPSQPAIDRHSAEFINFQLNTQEQGRVVWEGQSWPGQPMRWEVSKDAPRGQARPGQQQGEPPWRSGVRMRFPLLGEVAATVVLSGGQLHIQVETGSSDSGALLRAHAGALSSSMEAAGLALSSLTIGTAGDE